MVQKMDFLIMNWSKTEKNWIFKDRFNQSSINQKKNWDKYFGRSLPLWDILSECCELLYPIIFLKMWSFASGIF